jgi:Wax ester synthase-like Acyl-CoA acyltransferase domain
MEWMSAIDASFLHVENDVTPMHIGGVSIFEGPPPAIEEVRAMIAGKIDWTPRYRQKVRFVPLAVGSPVWVDDPHFNPVRRSRSRSRRLLARSPRTGRSRARGPRRSSDARVVQIVGLTRESARHAALVGAPAPPKQGAAREEPRSGQD